MTDTTQQKEQKNLTEQGEKELTELNNAIEKQRDLNFHKFIAAQSNQLNTEVKLGTVIPFTQETSQTHQEKESSITKGKETITRNAKKYLEKWETLSESEFQELFANKESLQQGQLGNCYLVSSIITLSNRPFFDKLMRTSIKKATFQNGEKGYIIKMPLGEPNGREILIKDSEISTAKIKGSLGYKLLEITYMKNRRPDTKGGNSYPPITENEWQKSIGGRMQEALQKFLGSNNIGFCTFGNPQTRNQKEKLSSLSSKTQQEITNALKNYNAEVGNKFIELITGKGKHGDRDSFQVNGKTFYYSHAYVLNDVRKNSQGNIKSISIKNPRNDPQKSGGTAMELSLQEFLDTFSIMGYGTIHENKLMDDIPDATIADHENQTIGGEQYRI